MRDYKGKLLLIFKVFSAILTIFAPQNFEDDSTILTFASAHLLMLRKGTKIPAVTSPKNCLLSTSNQNFSLPFHARKSWNKCSSLFLFACSVSLVTRGFLKEKELSSCQATFHVLIWLQPIPGEEGGEPSTVLQCCSVVKNKPMLQQLQIPGAKTEINLLSCWKKEKIMVLQRCRVDSRMV